MLTAANSERNSEHLRQLAARGVGGQNRDAQWRQKVSESLTGRRLSEEHRRKLAAINNDPVLKARRRAARIARRKPAETYRTVHKRLVTDRGAARGYPCADCGNPAKDWSHDCQTWENVAQEITGKRLVFSTDLSTYQARCHSCHHLLDSQPMPWLERPSP
ncbi:hypothetical protein PBI_YUNGJAMAL_60 [Mycobacterium phage YungJamal]|uniref:Uncharacterized protein n=1 Tax=Mycobacterium phage YungJamal TaxID=1505226 RepID=A0A076G8L4_BPMCO|nr:hypothetical protein PBI_YUNGJAMAL_60 [Mycobacterium phage YungJamal]